MKMYFFVCVYVSCIGICGGKVCWMFWVGVIGSYEMYDVDVGDYKLIFCESSTCFFLLNSFLNEYFLWYKSIEINFFLVILFVGL